VWFLAYLCCCSLLISRSAVCAISVVNYLRATGFRTLARMRRKECQGKTVEILHSRYYVRMKPSSSDAAHAITLSIDSFPCVNLAIILVSVAWLYICIAMGAGAGAPQIETI
jgi:hypothetical protein